MNLFIKIKKIISSVLLLCLFVSLIPVQTFAQATTTPSTMDAYAGWQQTKTYNSFVKATEYMNIAGLDGDLNDVDVRLDQFGNNEGGSREIDDDYFGALSVATNKFESLKFDVDQDKITMVGTNNGKVAYYYQDGSNTPLLIGYAVDGKLYVPPNGGVDARFNQQDPNNKNTLTQAGFMNAVDAATGKQIGSSLAELESAELRQENVNELNVTKARVDEIKKILETGQEGGKPIDAARREQLTAELKAKEAKQAVQQRRADGSNEVTNSTKINTDACPSGFTDIMKFFTSPACVVTLMAIVANTVLKLSAFILYWTGNLFDYAIEIAVNSAEFLNRLQIVEPTWAFVRDILNMTFIFILLFVAVQILLGRGGYTAKGSIARLVLVAILMNFSLFAAKAMVDISNIISLNIYEGIKVREDKAVAGENRGNVSARIMTTLGLSGIYNFGQIFDGNAIPGCGGAPGTILTVGVFGTILMIITALTFLLAAVLFFLRMLNIIVLFVSSPIWVWGYVMEGEFFKKSSQWWLSNMLHVVKFPIIYMLMLYVSLAMFAQLNTAQRGTDGKNVSFIKLICDTTTSNDASVLTKLPLILNFIIVIAALVGIILYSAKNSGKAGVFGTGKIATDFSNKMYDFQKRFTTDRAQGIYNKSRAATVGLAGAAARGGVTLAKDSVRKGANATSNYVSGKLGEAAAGGGAVGGIIAKSPKLQTAVGMLASGLKDRKYMGETEKEASERRTKGTKARAATLAGVQADALKIDSEAAWKKDHPNATAADYQDYLRNKVKLITQTTLGGLEGETAKVNADGSTVNTEDFVRADIYEDIKDSSGNTIGRKLNQEKLYKNIQEARKYHEEHGNLLKAEKSKRFGWVTKEKAKARIKAQDDAVKKALAEVRKKESGKPKKVKESREQLERLPTDFLDITRDKAVSDKLNSIITSYTTARDKILKDTNSKLQGANLTVAQKNDIADQGTKEIEDLQIATKDKVMNERNKIEANIAKLESDIAAEEEKEKNKDK